MLRSKHKHRLRCECCFSHCLSSRN